MKEKSSNYSEWKKQNIPSINAISIPPSHFVVQKSMWESLPSELWVEVIFPFMLDNIKTLLDFAKISHQFRTLANDKKTVFNLFTKTFYYLRECFSKTPNDLKNPLKEMGKKLINALETYDKKNLWHKANHNLLVNNNLRFMDFFSISRLEIYPDFHRKFTIQLEIGDIDAAITTLIKTSLDRGTLAEDLSSFRSHGGQTVLGELKKPFKFISISNITENFQQKIHLQNNYYLDKIFYTDIIDYYRKLINNSPVNVSFFQRDWENRADAVLETIIKSKGISSQEMARLYVLSYACSQFYLFSKIHAEFKKIPEYEYFPVNYPCNILDILSYCIIYKQSELLRALFEQILPLRIGHAAVLIKLSIEYSDPLTLHLVLEKKREPEPFNESLNTILDEIKNPVFLYNLIKLRPQKFLNSAFEMELNKKIIIIELLSGMGCNAVTWFLASWRNHILTKGQEQQPSTQKEFGDLIVHFGRQNIPNLSANLDSLILLILKLSPSSHKNAQQILESKQLFRPQVLHEATNLINKKIVTDSLVSEGLLTSHKRKRNSNSNQETQQSSASSPGNG